MAAVTAEFLIRRILSTAAGAMERKRRAAIAAKAFILRDIGTALRTAHQEYSDVNRTARRAVLWHLSDRRCQTLQ